MAPRNTPPPPKNSHNNTNHRKHGNIAWGGRGTDRISNCNAEIVSYCIHRVAQRPGAPEHHSTKSRPIMRYASAWVGYIPTPRMIQTPPGGPKKSGADP